MKVRRGATDLAGVLLVDKPAGPTSHDVVAALRRATGERRIGHAGTLDPAATGLLLVLVGRATRLERYLVGHDKTYEATISFGTATDTLDAEGAVTETAPVPAVVRDADFARTLLSGLVGARQQMPPAYSAIKRDGVAAHRIARAGGEPDLHPRPVIIHEADLLAIDPEATTWQVRFGVSKGTYIRSLADEIGRIAGTVAHLSALRRTASGAARVDDAMSPDAIVTMAEEGRLALAFTDPVPLLEMRVIECTPEDVRDGRPLEGHAADDESVRFAVASAQALFGVYRASGGRLLAETVLSPEIAR